MSKKNATATVETPVTMTKAERRKARRAERAAARKAEQATTQTAVQQPKGKKAAMAAAVIGAAMAANGKATKATPAPAVSTPKEKDPLALNGSEVKILTALANSRTKKGEPIPLNRNGLRTATGIQKGYSKLLGAATREVSEDSLQGRGFVKVETPAEDAEERGLLYTITPAGRKALAAAATE